MTLAERINACHGKSLRISESDATQMIEDPRFHELVACLPYWSHMRVMAIAGTGKRAFRTLDIPAGAPHVIPEDDE